MSYRGTELWDIRDRAQVFTPNEIDYIQEKRFSHYQRPDKMNRRILTARLHRAMQTEQGMGLAIALGRRRKFELGALTSCSVA